MSSYSTKDSGKRQEYESGMKRDIQDGKPMFDLIIPEGVSYEDLLITRWARLMERGMAKYGRRNWERANSTEEKDRFRSSAFRHFMQWFCGEEDEDHAAATIFNINAVETMNAKSKLIKSSSD